MSQVNPMPDYIFVKPMDAPTKTQSGILLPETAQDKPKTAVVVAIGKNVTEVKVGDNVIYNDGYDSGNVSFPVDKVEHTIVHRKNIVATVK